MKRAQKLLMPKLRWVSALRRLPSSPGVYWFLGKNDEVLYVGKAKNLKNRVRSYARATGRLPKTSLLVHEAVKLKFEVLTSELEALLTEAELIRAHQPHYNILLKDDKSPLYIYITDEPFPRVLTAHKEALLERKRMKYIFGPFPSGYKARYVLHLARGIFRWCNERVKTGKPCFYAHIHLCSGACAGKVSQEAYAEMIDDLRNFLRGRTSPLLQDMKKRMTDCVSHEQYEEAAVIRDRIQMIQSVTQEHRVLPPDMQLPQLQQKEADEMMVRLRRLISMHIAVPKNYPLKRIEGYDISNTQGMRPTASMVVFTDGQVDKSQYRSFNIRLGEKPNDYGMMKEALMRRQRHPEWGMPDLVMLDGGKGQLRAGVSVWNWTVPICALAKEPDRLFFYNPVTKVFTMTTLLDGDPGSTLLRRIRDEAHRFAKRHHVMRRTKVLVGV